MVNPENPTVVVMSDWPPQEMPNALGDFTELVETLTGRSATPEMVQENIQSTVESPNAALCTVPQDDHVVAMATLNRCPTLTGRGRRYWIDDVATLASHRQRGLSRLLMDAMESSVVPTGCDVYLTSQPHRGAARAGYEKRGYTLLNEESPPTVVFRTEQTGVTPPSGVEVLDASFDERTVEQLAALLQEQPQIVAQNLARAIASPITRVFVSKDRGGVQAVAVKNEPRIPVGKKPWIDSIAGNSLAHTHAVVTAAVADTDYKYVNVVAPADTNLGEGWFQRSTGLYVKQLGAAAVRA